MTERELIAKLKELGKISPRKDWVALTKIQILGQETESSAFFGIFPRMIFGYKPALAAATVLFTIFFGLFGFAQNSVPGDFLFSIKKITERGQSVFVSEDEMPRVSLELANKRLEELVRIAETNQVNKLAPALNEFQASVSEVNKSLSRIEATSSDSVVIKNIVDKTKNLEKRVEEVRSLGVVIDEEEISELRELQGISSRLEIRLLVSDLEQEALTQEQKEALAQMKELIGQENYSEALELYLAEFSDPVILEPAGEEPEEDLEDEKAEEDEESLK